jgi:tetratricopeptide (TPR) repeat protein
VVKAIAELQTILGLTDISICYVMSDFTSNNIQYYETHPALMPFIKSGMLDFALFDMEVERPITLLKKNINLTADLLSNPLIVYANYIFDTISHDAFTVHAGKLYELLLSIQTPANNMRGDTPIDMEQLNIDFKVNEITGQYYNDPQLDSILEEYKNVLRDSSVLFPIGSIRAIKLLQKISHNKLFIIASDKGYSSLGSLENLGHPSLSFHGSFSMMVNFHAIANYFKTSGGDYFFQTPRKGIKTSVFCTGFQLTDLPLTRLAITEFLEGLSPADYFTLHRRMSDTFQDCSLDVIAAHMNLAHWDPHVFSKLANRVNSLADNAESDSVTFLANNMHKIAANYYYMPKSDCVLFEIAVFFHTIKQYETALTYYKAAKEFIGDQFGLFYNTALCEHHLHLLEDSLVDFKAAERLDPNSKEAKEWIAYLEKELQENV